MTDLKGDDPQLLRQEFHAFWSAGLRGRDYLDQSAIVCYLDLDQEEITLTRIFAAGDDDSRGERAAGEDRAEDLLVAWLQEDALVRNASSIELSAYMNYSPLRLTADGLVMVLDELKAMGKKVKAGIKFVELYKTEPGEEDCEENREGLRILQSHGVKVDVVKERDWLYLMQTLTRGSAKGLQEERNAAARQRLTGILRDPRDEETSTCDCGSDVTQLVRGADLLTILHKDTEVAVAKQQTATQCEGSW